MYLRIYLLTERQENIQMNDFLFSLLSLTATYLCSKTQDSKSIYYNTWNKKK